MALGGLIGQWPCPQSSVPPHQKHTWSSHWAAPHRAVDWPPMRGGNTKWEAKRGEGAGGGGGGGIKRLGQRGSWLFSFLLIVNAFGNVSNVNRPTGKSQHGIPV